MKARPILFSGAMVRALLAGTKTQTRRIVKPQPEHAPLGCYYSRTGWARGTEDGACTCNPVPAPYGAPGDLLIVRETWRTTGDGGRCDDRRPVDLQPHAAWYDADGKAPADECCGKTRVSIHMPRWASRLTLEITEVRVERLQDISPSDAEAEGIEEVTREVAPRDPRLRFWKRYRDGGWNSYVDHPAASYASLWTEINGDGSWEANPWVWAISFKVHQQNVDALINDRSAA